MSLSITACADDFKRPPEKDVFEDKQVVALAKAACQGQVDKVKALAEAGVDVNTPSVDGGNVLVWALACKNLAGTKALLRHGANPNALIRNGYTPVLFVGHFDDVRFLEALLDYGGDVNAYNDVNKFDTVLQRTFAYGVHKEYWEPYHLLINRGVNYDKETEISESSFLEFICGVYARFGEAERLFDLGFDGDLDALIKTVETVYEDSLLENAKQGRTQFLKKLYAVKDLQDSE